MDNNTEKMLDWIEEVKGRCKFNELDLMKAWCMRHEDKLSYKKIAEKLNVSINTPRKLFNENYYKICKESARKSQRIHTYKKDKVMKKKSNDKYAMSDKGKKCEEKKRKIKSISRILFNEAKKEPTKELKMVWDGKGLWSRNYDFCEDCKENLYIHKAHGLCAKCYEKQKIRVYDRKKYQEFKKTEKYIRKKEEQKIRDNFIKKVQSGEIPITPKMEHILSFLD